jgi:hypothetical protein
MDGGAVRRHLHHERRVGPPARRSSLEPVEAHVDAAREDLAAVGAAVSRDERPVRHHHALHGERRAEPGPGASIREVNDVGLPGGDHDPGGHHLEATQDDVSAQHAAQVDTARDARAGEHGAPGRVARAHALEAEGAAHGIIGETCEVDASGRESGESTLDEDRGHARSREREGDHQRGGEKRAERHGGSRASPRYDFHASSRRAVEQDARHGDPLDAGMPSCPPWRRTRPRRSWRAMPWSSS